MFARLSLHRRKSSCEIIGSHKRILSDDLKVRHITKEFVPGLLNNEEKVLHISVCGTQTTSKR